MVTLAFIQPSINAAQKFSTAGFYAVEDSQRTVENFNPGWRFIKKDVQGAEKSNFDDSTWEAANLPHGLEILGENGSGGRNYQGKAWYRKKFDVKKNNGRTFIYFESVMGEAQVYINGKKVAEHFGGYLPFAADITDVITLDGKNNTIAVMTNNSNSKLYPPGQAQDRLDFAYFGGIYRDSYLIQTNDVHVTLPEISTTIAGAGVFPATLDIKGNTAKLEVRTEIKNNSLHKKELLVRNTLVTAENEKITSIEQVLTLEAGEKQQLSKQFTANNVRLWHPDNPYLHYIKTEIIFNNKVIDSLKTKIGIRLFEMKGAEGLFINRKWIGKKLIGANRHQDHQYLGNALPNSGQWRDVKLLRKGGCNIIRAGHYPQDPAFYDACDELGMLTTTANPGWHFYNFKEKIFEERLYQDTRNLVRRDRNVASILMWETAINEFPRQPDYAMSTMHKLAHQEFPFPGMYTVADHHEAKKGGLDMYYHGHDKDVNSFNREYGDGGEVDNWYSQNASTRVNMKWGETALLNAAIKQTKTLNYRHSTSKVRLGGTIWCGIDHYRGYHPDPFMGGLLNAVRIPRTTYYLYKSQYDANYKVPGIESGPMLHIANELTQISPKDILIYSNCDEIRLTWCGDLIGTEKPQRKNYEHMPHPPFVFKDAFEFTKVKRRGKNKIDPVLIAEGFINGKLVTRVEKRYPQRSEQLKLSLGDEGLNMVADGSDMIRVYATVVDINGTKKVLADESVYFSVVGAGELIGGRFNNANPTQTSYGVATALVRASTEAGTITVTAHSNGLKSDAITIKTVTPYTPLNLNETYVSESKKSDTETILISQTVEVNDLPLNIQKLQGELKKLRQDIVGKDQTIMDLRSKVKE